MKSVFIRMVAAVATALPLALAAATTSLAPVHVDLLGRAQVYSAQVRLGDVARIHGDNLDAVRAAESVNLGASPRMGESLKLTRSRLEAVLSSDAMGTVNRFAWTGATDVRIDRAGQMVDAQDVCRAAQEWLGDWLRLRSTEFKLAPVCRETSWAVAPGRIELRPRPFADGQLPTKRMQVWMDIWTDGRFARSVAVAIDVQATQQGWAAREDLKAQQVLRLDQLEQRDIDITGLMTAPLLSLAEPANLRLRKPLLTGQVLTVAHVESQPLVARGQRVTLRTQSGVISLVTLAEALQDGRPGQQVLVRVNDSARPVVAWVVGPNQVELKQ